MRFGKHRCSRTRAVLCALRGYRHDYDPLLVNDEFDMVDVRTHVRVLLCSCCLWLLAGACDVTFSVVRCSDNHTRWTSKYVGRPCRHCASNLASCPHVTCRSHCPRQTRSKHGSWPTLAWFPLVASFVTRCTVQLWLPTQSQVGKALADARDRIVQPRRVPFAARNHPAHSAGAGLARNTHGAAVDFTTAATP